MVRSSSTSTSSAQVEGQSCGQAEAAILPPCDERTTWFIAFAGLLDPVPSRLGFHALVRKLFRSGRIDDQRVFQRFLVPHVPDQIAQADDEARARRGRPVMQCL